jgi:cell division transport system permease protein
MSKKDKISSFQLKTSYFTTIISISLVLFLLGLIGILVLNAQNLSDFIKENFSVDVILYDNMKEVDMIRIQKDIETTKFVKDTRFISKEMAAQEMQEELGEDFVEFLGYNPLLASIEVYLHSKYAHPDSLNFIVQKLESYPQVKEVYYQKSLIHQINENIQKISLIILIFTALLFIISTVLINNTIRLSVYSKRFIIHSMKLVGATKAFIRTPFMLKSTLHGIYGALFAILLLLGVMYLAQKEMREFIMLFDLKLYGILFAGVIIIGIFITTLSTYFAVNKYLRIDKDQLYYR